MRWIALLLPLACGAQDWGSLHIVNADLPLSDRLLVQFHVRARTNDHFHDYFQSRGGPIAWYRLRSRLSILGGYYFLDEESVSGLRSNFHRVFGGVNYVVPTPRAIKIESRSLVERFIATPSGSYMRVRQRLWLTLGQRKVRPYFQSEGLVQRGLPTGRFGAGLQFSSRSGRDLFVGYEFRHLPGAPRLQLITSTFQFRLRPKRD